MTVSNDGRRDPMTECSEWFRDLTESLPHLVWVCTTDGRCEYLSKQWLDYTGVDEARQREGGWLDLIHPDDRADVDRAWAEATTTGGLLNIELRVRGADGSYRWFTARATPVRDASGAIVRWYGSSTDIEDRKQTEEALRRTNSRLALLSDTASQLLQTSDPQGLAQSLCERVMEHLNCHVFFNYLRSERPGFLHLNAYAGIPADEAARIEWLEYGASVCGCVAACGTRVVAEDIMRVRDPRTDLVRGYGVQAYACHPLLGPRDEVIGTLSFGSRGRASFSDGDLALMKAVSDQVATAMDRIRLIDSVRQRAEEVVKVMEVAPIAIWVGRDPECREITGNRYANTLYEAGDGENVSASSTDRRRFFLNGRELTADELPMQYAAAHNEDMLGCELEMMTPSGVRRVIWGSASPLVHADGRVRGAVGAFMDVTEQRDLEAHRLEFHRRMILAATDGKLVVTERQRIDDMVRDVTRRWEIRSLSDLREMRDDVAGLLRAAGMQRERVAGFLGCVMEAAGNALKHADGGSACLFHPGDDIAFAISDTGSGIGAMALPDLALTRGYSTAGTLGMGYKLMLKFADRVYLSTGPGGTTVAIRMAMTPSSEPDILQRAGI